MYKFTCSDFVNPHELRSIALTSIVQTRDGRGVVSVEFETKCGHFEVQDCFKQVENGKFLKDLKKIAKKGSVTQCSQQENLSQVEPQYTQVPQCVEPQYTQVPEIVPQKSKPSNVVPQSDSMEQWQRQVEIVKAELRESRRELKNMRIAFAKVNRELGAKHKQSSQDG